MMMISLIHLKLSGFLHLKDSHPEASKECWRVFNSIPSTWRAHLLLAVYRSLCAG